MRNNFCLIIYLFACMGLSHARSIKIKYYEQFITKMGLYKVNFQCSSAIDCDVQTFHKGILIGQSKIKYETFALIKRNFVSHFEQIKIKKECTKGNIISIKTFKNYDERIYTRCYKKADPYSFDFQKNFSKVFAQIPPRK
jgi:hypothetical protein